MAKYVVGAWVICIRSDEGDEAQVGWTGIVDEVSEAPYVRWDIDGSYSCVSEDQIEFFNGEIPAAPKKGLNVDIGSAATSQHYNGFAIQPIELMQIALSPEEFQGFLKGNLMKYTIRAGQKQGEAPEKDNNKAKQYKLWLDLAQAGKVIDPRKDVV